MRFLFRGLLYLVVLGALGLLGYAYLGDLTPVQGEMSIPVPIDGN